MCCVFCVYVRAISCTVWICSVDLCVNNFRFCCVCVCRVHFPFVIIIIKHLKTIITIRRFIQIPLHFFRLFSYSPSLSSLHFLFSFLLSMSLCCCCWFFLRSLCVSFVLILWHFLLRPSCTLMYFSNLHAIPPVHLLNGAIFGVVLMLLMICICAHSLRAKVRFFFFFHNFFQVFSLFACECVCVSVIEKFLANNMNILKMPMITMSTNTVIHTNTHIH